MSITKIPASEFKIMKFIWETDYEMSSKNISFAMENKYNWKHSTTLSLLSKLVKRKFLLAEKIDRYTHYKVVVKYREYLNLETRYFFNSIHSNSIESLINSLNDCGFINNI
ncbi:BlaI/MecI/CopY family transcriptional regulator [Clostridioides difficile]|uniref:BlaI/MecI/CopY family transcriptional regulator n=1 Tax=Clostridioides difficile TaxID=1496 RepID=UPI0030801DA5